MDEQTRAAIKEVLPNFPDAVAAEWLAPFVVERGSPGSSDRWSGLLGGKPLEFWRSVSWSLESIDLAEVVAGLTPASNQRLVEMESDYFFGARNGYAAEIPDGKETTLCYLTFLESNGRLPSPPVLLLQQDGRIEIMDGNHRLLAFVLAFRQRLRSVGSIHEAWIGREPASA